MPIRLHVDDPDLLREATTFTARTTAFSARLVEKDYYGGDRLEGSKRGKAPLPAIELRTETTRGDPPCR